MLCMVYSSDQFDGICAAACVVRAFRLKGISCRFGGTLSLSDTREKDLAELTGQLNVGIAVLDYPPENILGLDSFLRKLAAKCTLVYWSFSQQQKPETLKLLSQHVKRVDYAENTQTSFSAESICSTTLAAMRFLPGDPVGKQLSILATDIKFWLRQDNRAAKLADLLASGFDRRAIVDALSKGVVWDAVFEHARTDYLEKKAKAFEDLLKRLTIKTYLKYTFGFSLASSVLSTADACQYLLDKHAGIDVAIMLYKSGKITFRRREGCDLDLNRLGRYFGGGGQRYASGGFFLDKEITVEHWEQVLFALDRTLKDYFLG